MKPNLEKPSFLNKEPTRLGFGTSGIRALVKDMTDLECYINTKGFLNYLASINDISPGGMVCLAGDLRPSTNRIMATAAAAIIHSSYKVDNCGLIPTPAMAYYATQKSWASIMITGSHIPDNRNGIKYYKSNGEVFKDDEAGIIVEVDKFRQAEYAKNANETLFDKNGRFKKPVSLGPVNEEAKKTFIRRYLDIFPPDCFSGKTIIVYQHSAVGRDLLVNILESLGAQVIPVKRSNKFVAIDTENITAKDKALFELLANKYKHKHPYAIVSTDGDGDRPFVISEKGEAFRGDLLGIIVCQYLKANFAVFPISANDAVPLQCKKNGIKFKYTKIGSPYVIKAMEEAITRGETKVVSWEVNGGFLTGTDFLLNGNILRALPTRDAFLPILCVLAQSIKRKLALSELFAEIYNRYTDAGILDNFPQDIGQKIVRHFSLPEDNNVEQVSFEIKMTKITDFAGKDRALNSDHSMVKVLLNQKRGLEKFFNPSCGFDSIIHINYLDGVRVTFANGDVVHLRPSGNAPQFRVYSNANSQARASEIVRLSISEPNGIIQQIKSELVS